MKKTLGIIINILSLLATIAIYFTIQIHYGEYEINKIYELPPFHKSEKFLDITKNKINDVFNLIDYKNVYEINDKPNMQLVVATKYENDSFTDITLNDILLLADKYNIEIDQSNNIIEKANNTHIENVTNTYANLVYVKEIPNNYKTKLSEYSLCKNVLADYSNYLKLNNQFSNDNSNFTYIIRYYNNDKQKEYYNNGATLNAIFNSNSFLYISDTKNSEKTNINLNINDNIMKELESRMPFENAGFYFACSIDTEYPKNDIYKTSYNSYINQNNSYHRLIRILIISIFVLLSSFFITILIFIDSNYSNKTISNNKIKYDRITKISHDVKTPLTSIINYSDILAKEVNKKDINISLVKQYVHILTEKSSVLKKLIDDVLLTTKIKNNYIGVNMQKINVTSLVEQMITEYADIFKKSELNVKRTYSDEELYINGDSMAMYRIFTNLFDNISKYAMKNTDVNINVNKKGRTIIINIINLTANHIVDSTDKLMSIYVKDRNNHGMDSYGLGLSIVNDLTALLNGYFDIDYDANSKRFLAILSFRQYID